MLAFNFCILEQNDLDVVNRGCLVIWITKTLFVEHSRQVKVFVSRKSGIIVRNAHKLVRAFLFVSNHSTWGTEFSAAQVLVTATPVLRTIRTILEIFVANLKIAVSVKTTLRWNCMPKAPHFLQITAKQQYCPFFTVFLTIKTLSQNISITLLQISLKLHEHRGCYWRKKLPWMTFEEQFLVLRYTAASKIANSVILLLWQLRCRCHPDHNKFSSLSNTTVMAIFPKRSLWRRSLCSNLGGICPEKLYRATLMHVKNTEKY